MTQPLRCSCCVLPNTVTGLGLADSDVCGVCTRARRATSQDDPAENEASLEEAIEDVRRRGKESEFDCVIGISGGRDSSYMAYLLRKQHNLRCLGLYYRTVFTPEVTHQNVQRLTSILGIPLVEIQNIPWEYHRRVARGYCQIWKRNPVGPIANLACAPCKLVNRELIRLAHQHRIPTLILGGNRFEEIQFLSTYQEGDLDTSAHSLGRQVKKLCRIARKGTGLAIRSPSVLRHPILAARASLLYLTPFSAYLQLRYPRVHRFDYFFHADWVESEVERVIETELGWELPPDCLTTWKADCEFAEMKNYMFHAMYHATYLDGLLSNLVRAGQLTREEALKRIKNQPVFSKGRMERVLKLLELPDDFVSTDEASP